MSVALALLETLMETRFDDRERLPEAEAPTLLHLEGSEVRGRGLASLRVNMHVRERDCMFVSIRNTCMGVSACSVVSRKDSNTDVIMLHSISTRSCVMSRI